MIFDLRPAVDRERRPDVAFVSYERWASDRRMPKTRSWAVVPDLAIEVVSTTNTADEVADKLGEYFRVRVRQIWVVYPRQCMIYVYTSPKEVRVLTVGDVLDAGDVLPGLSLPVGWTASSSSRRSELRGKHSGWAESSSKQPLLLSGRILRYSI